MRNSPPFLRGPSSLSPLLPLPGLPTSGVTISRLPQGSPSRSQLKESAPALASCVLPAFDLVENFHLDMGVGEEGETHRQIHREILSKKERGEGMWGEL